VIMSEEWCCFIGKLFSNHIRIEEEYHDTLAWSKNPLTRDFTAKLGYKAHLEYVSTDSSPWWWEHV
jgi:hypothetical protein